MSRLIAPVRIALGAVVLDTPDRTGCYIAKDSVGGWSYLVTDAAGDHRFRGDGSCAGGLDVALRWALLAALNHVPDCRRIRLFVDSPQAHTAMLRLARVDELVIAGMVGKVLTMLIRPDDKSVRRAIGAAEQAALALLRERARSESLRIATEAAAVAAEVPTEPVTAADTDLAEWRAKRIRSAPPDHTVAKPVGKVSRRPPPDGLLVNMMAPLVEGLRDRLAGVGRRRKPEVNPAIAGWMRDFEMQIQTVTTQLEGVGL